MSIKGNGSEIEQKVVGNQDPTDGIITQDIFKKPIVFQFILYLQQNFTNPMKINLSFFFPGDDRDSTGSLLSIDSQEGVVKLDQNGDVKMLQLKYLCKLKDDM